LFVAFLLLVPERHFMKSGAVPRYNNNSAFAGGLILEISHLYRCKNS